MSYAISWNRHRRNAYEKQFSANQKKPGKGKRSGRPPNAICDGDFSFTGAGPLSSGQETGQEEVDHVVKFSLDGHRTLVKAKHPVVKKQKL